MSPGGASKHIDFFRYGFFAVTIAEILDAPSVKNKTGVVS